MKKRNLLLSALAGSALFFLYAPRGRTGHPEIGEMKRFRYAHRGLHGAGAPENSLAAFQKAAEAGYGSELDVHLMADGSLGVIHDYLPSVPAFSGRTMEQMGKDALKGTEIPQLFQVLEAVSGRVPLIIELKSTRENYARLCLAVCRTLDMYPGEYFLESFDPRCVLWLKRHRPELVRGQLTENFFRSDSTLHPAAKFVMRHQLLNFITRPDFVAYRYRDRKTPSNVIARRLWKLPGVAWTVREGPELRQAEREGWIPIFEKP